jgi:nucleoside-diphosphate-sugar epimerase
VLSTFGVARLLAGKAALAPYPPDHLHDFTYVPDFARALVTLINAPDDAYGEAWHVPNGPTETIRQLITLAAKLIGLRPRPMVLPQTLAPLIALFDADAVSLPKCASSGTGLTAWIHRSSPDTSGTMRRRSRRD